MPGLTQPWQSEAKEQHKAHTVLYNSPKNEMYRKTYGKAILVISGFDYT